MDSSPALHHSLVPPPGHLPALAGDVCFAPLGFALRGKDGSVAVDGCPQVPGDYAQSMLCNHLGIGAVAAAVGRHAASVFVKGGRSERLSEVSAGKVCCLRAGRKYQLRTANIYT